MPVTSGDSVPRKIVFQLKVNQPFFFQNWEWSRRAWICTDQASAWRLIYLPRPWFLFLFFVVFVCIWDRFSLAVQHHLGFNMYPWLAGSSRSRAPALWALESQVRSSIAITGMIDFDWGFLVYGLLFVSGHAEADDGSKWWIGGRLLHFLSYPHLGILTLLTQTLPNCFFDLKKSTRRPGRCFSWQRLSTPRLMRLYDP